MFCNLPWIIIIFIIVHFRQLYSSFTVHQIFMYTITSRDTLPCRRSSSSSRRATRRAPWRPPTWTASPPGPTLCSRSSSPRLWLTWRRACQERRSVVWRCIVFFSAHPYQVWGFWGMWDFLMADEKYWYTNKTKMKWLTIQFWTHIQCRVLLMNIAFKCE